MLAMFPSLPTGANDLRSKLS